MKALVTGAAGFIGSYLIKHLLDKDMEVVGFDLAPIPPELDKLDTRFTYIQGDLSSEVDIYRTMVSQEITEVFHLGALLAGACERDPFRGFRVNFQSTQTLLDAASVLDVNRFVMLSSISVFGREVPEPVKDDAPKNPETVYGQTKLACEHLLRWYANKKKLDTRALRLTWVFGPGRSRGITALYSSLILDAFARGDALEVENPDEQGDWLYINDAIKAIWNLWESKTAPQRIYNIAGGIHSIREVVEIAARLRPDSRVKLAEEGTRLSPYPAAYDDSPARHELGWRPDYDIEAAVREHLAIVSTQPD